MNHKDLSLFVYEAIEKPQRRQDLLATFAEIIDASAAAVAVEDRQLRWATFRVTHGMDQETIDSYCHYYASLNPYALRRSRTPGHVVKSVDLVSEAELHDTEFYHGWFKPRGWGHSSAVILDATETEQIYLFAIRPPNRPFREEETASLKALAPHLAQATRLAKSLWVLQNENKRLRFGAAKTDPLARFKLSPREFLIGTELALGQSIKDMAHKAGLAVATVRWHVQSVYKKCGVRSRPEFMRLLQDLSRQ